ncbi:MAG: hypothetical protein HY271_10065 [Deltaproteobacteria bacterium]|nr:hypothetical protein [Deltaproteobacteria bacterium]
MSVESSDSGRDQGGIRHLAVAEKNATPFGRLATSLDETVLELAKLTMLEFDDSAAFLRLIGLASQIVEHGAGEVGQRLSDSNAEVDPHIVFAFSLISPSGRRFLGIRMNRFNVMLANLRHNKRIRARLMNNALWGRQVPHAFDGDCLRELHELRTILLDAANENPPLLRRSWIAVATLAPSLATSVERALSRLR